MKIIPHGTRGNWPSSSNEFTSCKWELIMPFTHVHTRFAVFKGLNVKQSFRWPPRLSECSVLSVKPVIRKKTSFTLSGTIGLLMDLEKQTTALKSRDHTKVRECTITKPTWTRSMVSLKNRTNERDTTYVTTANITLIVWLLINCRIYFWEYLTKRFYRSKHLSTFLLH